MLKALAGLGGIEISDKDLAMIEGFRTILSVFPTPAVKEVENMPFKFAVCWKPAEYPIDKLENLATILTDLLPVTAEAIVLTLTEPESDKKNAAMIQNCYHALVFPQEQKP